MLPPRVNESSLPSSMHSADFHLKELKLKEMMMGSSSSLELLQHHTQLETLSIKGCKERGDSGGDPPPPPKVLPSSTPSGHRRCSLASGGGGLRRCSTRLPAAVPSPMHSPSISSSPNFAAVLYRMAGGREAGDESNPCPPQPDPVSTTLDLVPPSSTFSILDEGGQWRLLRA